MMSYTFGDNKEASRRLRRLAEIYEPETRALLELASRPRRPALAVDLGCGPGWSTQLLDIVLRPQRTVGLDSSKRFIVEARMNHPKLEFVCHDILEEPFPIESAEILLCRFLLTHLQSPQKALQTWARQAKPHAILLVHETEKLESAHPMLQRYYEMVDELQRHYGQALNVGAILDASFLDTGWEIRRSESIVLEKPARDMAQLHVSNLRTWGKNDYAAQAFDEHELEELEAALDSVASGASDGGVVYNTAKQIVAERSVH